MAKLWLEARGQFPMKIVARSQTPCVVEIERRKMPQAILSNESARLDGTGFYSLINTTEARR